MNDIDGVSPQHRRLFEIASEQAGYFTSGQARSCGFSRGLLAHHAKRGRFIRVRRGVYRLSDYPSGRREDLMAAWIELGTGAVVSHESALELLELSDVIPATIHFTLPRSQRYRSAPPGVTLHTTTRRLGSKDRLIREGLPVTSPVRSIVDAAESGTSPDQVFLAVRQALDRGLATPAQLETAATGRGSRVESLVRRAIEEAGGR